MFKKRRKNQEQKKAVEDIDQQVCRHIIHKDIINSISISSGNLSKDIFKEQILTHSIQNPDKASSDANPKRIKAINEEDEEDIMESLGINKPKAPVARPKHKLKTVDFDEDGDALTQPKASFKPKKKKNLVNVEAIASVQNSVTNASDNFFNTEHGSRYSKEHIDQLKSTQLQSNKNVSEYIQQNEPEEEIKDHASDEEFDDEELKKMQNIKQIRHKKKLAEAGLAMNTNKSEFLAPKDVCMAEEGVEELRRGLQTEDLYSFNTTKNDMVLEDFGEGESWINNQLEKALGPSHRNYDVDTLTAYQGDNAPTDFVDTSEMRAIRMSMSKDVEDYTTDLELEISNMQKSIRRNKETLVSVQKGIENHEKDFAQAAATIEEKTPKFRALIDFTEFLEDFGGLLDEKEDQINHLYDNLKMIEEQYHDTVKNLKADEDDMDVDSQPHMQLGGRRSGLGFKKPRALNAHDKTSNSVNLLKSELMKDIEAAKSTLGDIFNNVKADYQSPKTIFNKLLSLYEEYIPDIGFPFEFEIMDMVDYIVPYIKIDLVQSFDLTTGASQSKISTITDLEKVREYLTHSSHPLTVFVEQ